MNMALYTDFSCFYITKNLVKKERKFKECLRTVYEVQIIIGYFSSL